MGSTNFLVFNPTKANQENDAAYTTDATRVGGAALDAVWPSNSANKTLYQAAMGVTALMTMMAGKGFTTSDADLTTLAGVLANILTTADLATGIQSAAWFSSLTLNAAAYSGLETTLAGTTAFSVTGQQPGQLVALILTQDATGGHTVTYSAQFIGGLQPDTTIGVTSVQLFKVDASYNLYAASPMLSSSGINGTAIGAVAAAAGRFSTLTLSGGAPSGQVLTGDGTKFVPQPSLGAQVMNASTGHTLGSVYHNTSGYPLLVSACAVNVQSGDWTVTGVSSFLTALVGATSTPSTPVAEATITNGIGYCTVVFSVPVGYYYKVSTDYPSGYNGAGRIPTLTSWVEWSY